MALPNKHQLKVNIHKDAKSLMEAIKKMFGGNTETKKVQKTLLKQQYENFPGLSSESLDQIHDSLKIYEAEVKSSSSTTPTTQNIAFVFSQNIDSTNESVSAVTSVSTASTKVLVSPLPSVDPLSDAVIYSFIASQSNNPQLDNDDLKQIDADDLEEMDLKWQMAMLTIRARMFLQRTGRNLGANGTTYIGFDTSKVECYNCHYEREFCKGVQRILNSDLRKIFEKAKQERDELKLILDKFQTSLKNLSQLLASQASNKTGLGYDNQVFNSTMFDCDEMFSFELDVSMPTSPVHNSYKSGEGYHVVPPPYTGTFMPPKPDLVFHECGACGA
nr:hypothetical protein [Tanacetum cinerariifolium]